MVKLKIASGIVVIVTVGLLSMLYIYQALNKVGGYLGQLDRVDVPFSIAAIEMEKNAGEYAFGVLRYISHPSPSLRVEIKHDKRDFLRYHNSYMQATESDVERGYGLHLAAKHKQLTSLGQQLIARRQQLDAAFKQVSEWLEQIDVIADKHMSEWVPQREPARSRRLAAIANIEAEAAELGFWLAAFDRRSSAQATQHLMEKVDELAGAIDRYSDLPLGTHERHFVEQARTLLGHIRDGAGQLLAGELALHGFIDKFVRVRDHMDALFDSKIQVLAERGLRQPQNMANDAIDRVQASLRYLIPLYLAVALVMGILLNLAIVRPLRRLATGVKTIGRGDLDYRVTESRRDEFGYLATQFNRMVARLQQTTVSRDALEASEGKLQNTVTDLRREIAEHEESKRKRDALQAQLRRSEAMAAVGSLVAGVAHEVRNPLFGISSTLDAMEASGEGGDKAQRYRQVLRREVERLNTLMTLLLEYGKPPTQDFSVQQFGSIIAEAVRNCTAVAQARDVDVIYQGSADGTLSANRERLLQVFVNLIDNAARHTPAGSQVTIDTQVSTADDGGRWLACRVMDAGAGFAPEDLPHVLEPFFSRRRKGTGLGLAIVQRIVEEHGATIEPGNRPQGGAVVTVRLPLVADTV